MIRTILVPLDGSPQAEGVLPAACRLARAAHATLLLIRVANAGPSFIDGAYAEIEAVTVARRYLDRLACDLAARGLVVRTDVFVHDPANAIATAALMHGADLIAMSTHGRSGLSRLLLGSVAEAVLRESALPVLLVRSTGHGSPPALRCVGPYRRIVVPLDGTPGAERALRFASGAGWAREADLLLLTSEQADAVPLVAEPYGLLAPQTFARAEQDMRGACAAARAYLEQAAERSAPSRRHQCHVTIGEPGAAIARLATEQETDLVVMATHARTGLSRLREGSVGAHVLRHADVPVLFIPATAVDALSTTPMQATAPAMVATP